MWTWTLHDKDLQSYVGNAMQLSKLFGMLFYISMLWNCALLMEKGGLLHDQPQYQWGGQGFRGGGG